MPAVRPGSKRSLRKRCLRLSQNERHPLYLLSLTGEELLAVAEISRISRDDGGKVIGYQRPEVRRHVQDIVDYLNSDEVIFPNSLILAFSSRVKFTASRGPQVQDGMVGAGILEIPIPVPGAAKPAWIVDGQQRALAISKSRRKDLSVPVNAFVADEVDLQRDQFLRINNTRPLPRGLISELLPEVASPNLPARLAAARIPAEVCELLNTREDSPFFGLIRRNSLPTEARRKAVVADASVIMMVQESLSSPSGCLFPYRNLATGETDFDGLWTVLTCYWSAVKATFPEAWGRPPSLSRLMGGTGIRAVGRLMDRVMASVNPRQAGAVPAVRRQLEPVRAVCHWTSGVWGDCGGLAWNEIQNVPRHLRTLSNFLIRTYVLGTGAKP